MKVGVLATMMAFLLVGGFALSAQAGPAGDADSDGVFDLNDKCSLDPTVPSPCALDDDNDGYGNTCDGDLNNDNATDFLDIPLFITELTGGAAGVGDINCDLATDFLDIPGFITQLGAGAPGPSGLPCAGTVPCP